MKWKPYFRRLAEVYCERELSSEADEDEEDVGHRKLRRVVNDTAGPSISL